MSDDRVTMRVQPACEVEINGRTYIEGQVITVDRTAAASLESEGYAVRTDSRDPRDR